MYCRYCGAEMTDDQVICTACGEENAQPKKKNWKPLVAVICCVALIIGMVVASLFGMGGSVVGEAVTAKESYTGTDDQVLASLDTVVATAGDFELTNEELQIAYWSTIYDFVSYYGEYASYWINFETPLDQQVFSQETGLTWQQYFLESAIKTWRRYEVLVALSEAEGIGMSQELQDHFASLPGKMEDSLETYGFETISEMVVHDFGVGGTYDAYESFMKLYYYSSEHYDRIFNGLEATDQEIEAFYANNLESFTQSGYTKDDGSIVDVRHILVTPGEDDEKPYTDAQWADAEAKAKALLNTWLEGEADEDSFAALAKEHSSCSSAAQGGLISDIMVGQMVQEFEDWCMEPHEYGDYGIVKTQFGYHLMFYVDGVELWYDVAKSNVLSEKMSDYLTAQEESYPLTVNYSKIWLGEAELG